MAEAAKRHLFTDIAIGAIFALALFLAGSEAMRLYRLQAVYSAPASTYIEPLKLSIPDFKEGEDPIIVYDRVIHQQFIGVWIVEIRRQIPGGWIAVCSPNGKVIFDPEKQQPELGTHLSWFLGKQPCTLLPGTYEAVATWTVERDGLAGNTSATLRSNVFKVL